MVKVLLLLLHCHHRVDIDHFIQNECLENEIKNEEWHIKNGIENKDDDKKLEKMESDKWSADGFVDYRIHKIRRSCVDCKYS
jgi:hypothetical protein